MIAKGVSYLAVGKKVQRDLTRFTIWLFNIAMENHHVLIGKASISMGHRNTMAMLVITRGHIFSRRYTFES
jgi:hypothetical protein